MIEAEPVTYYFRNIWSQCQGRHSGFLICILPCQLDKLSLCYKLREAILCTEKAAVDGGCLEDNLLSHIIVIMCLWSTWSLIYFLSLVNNFFSLAVRIIRLLALFTRLDGGGTWWTFLLRIRWGCANSAIAWVSTFLLRIRWGCMIVRVTHGMWPTMMFKSWYGAGFAMLCRGLWIVDAIVWILILIVGSCCDSILYLCFLSSKDERCSK